MWTQRWWTPATNGCWQYQLWWHIHCSCAEIRIWRRQWHSPRMSKQRNWCRTFVSSKQSTQFCEKAIWTERIHRRRMRCKSVHNCLYKKRCSPIRVSIIPLKFIQILIVFWKGKVKLWNFEVYLGVCVILRNKIENALNFHTDFFQWMCGMSVVESSRWSDGMGWDDLKSSIRNNRKFEKKISGWNAGKSKQFKVKVKTHKQNKNIWTKQIRLFRQKCFKN